MKSWGWAQLLLRLATLAAFVFMAGMVGNRLLRYRNRDVAREQEEDRANAAFLKTYGGASVRILQFYARDAQVVEGGSTVVCYGVVNAAAVRIDPPVEGVGPSLNRCLEVAPKRETRYTLTAQGRDGQSVAESFTLGVVADQETLPKITSFGILRQGVDQGRRFFVLNFTAENVVTVDIDPPVFPTLHGAPLGKFMVVPARTTAYTLTVTGKYGHKARKSLTIEVQ